MKSSAVNSSTTWFRAALVAAVLLAGACTEDSAGDPEISLPDVTLPADAGGDAGTDAGGDTGGDAGGDSGSTDSSGGDTGGDAGGDSGSTDSSGGDAAAASTGTDDGMDTAAWIALLVIVLAGAAWIGASSSAASRRRSDDAGYVADQQRRIDALVRNAYWAAGQADQALSTKDPTSLAGVPQTLQPHFVESETEAARLSGEVQDSALADALGQLGQRLSALRGGLSSYVRTAQQGGDLATARASLDSQRANTEYAAQQVTQLSASPS